MREDDVRAAIDCIREAVQHAVSTGGVVMFREGSVVEAGKSPTDPERHIWELPCSLSAVLGAADRGVALALFALSDDDLRSVVREEVRRMVAESERPGGKVPFPGGTP